MNLTLRLLDAVFTSYDEGVIALGTSLTVTIFTETLLAAAYDDPGGWYERLPELQQPRQPTLIPLGHDRYAFCGQVQRTHIEQIELRIYYHVLLDCGAAITLLTTDLEAAPERGELGQHRPEPGAWLHGVVALRFDWAENSAQTVAQAVHGSVISIDRLVLRPGPGYGEMHSETELPLTPLGPDQVFLTLKVYEM